MPLRNMSRSPRSVAGYLRHEGSERRETFYQDLQLSPHFQSIFHLTSQTEDFTTLPPIPHQAEFFFFFGGGGGGGKDGTFLHLVLFLFSDVEHSGLPGSLELG